MKIAGEPMISRIIERILKTKFIKPIVLAIPKTKENDILQKIAEKNT